jgi:hypothetical protein
MTWTPWAARFDRSWAHLRATYGSNSADDSDMNVAAHHRDCDLD